jgi:tetratricopeptide (TPR) repeat protein
MSSPRQKDLALKDHDSAIADFTEVIRLDPNNAAAFYNRGKAYWGKDNYERSAADYTEAVRLDPDNADYKTHLEEAKQRLTERNKK